MATKKSAASKQTLPDVIHDVPSITPEGDSPQDGGGGEVSDVSVDLDAAPEAADTPAPGAGAPAAPTGGAPAAGGGAPGPVTNPGALAAPAPSPVGSSGFFMGIPAAPETKAQHDARLGAMAGTASDIGWQLGTVR